MADERSALADSTAATGWQRRQDERVDIYLRGAQRVRVIWQGDSAISGATRFQDDMMENYTRELGTVRAWMAG
ncbi:MAG: hypothetical protein WCE30_06295 [Mycobacterium sp.]